MVRVGSRMYFKVWEDTVTRDMCQTAVKHDGMNRKSSLNHLKWLKMILGNNGWWRMTRDMCQTAVNHKNLNRKYGLFNCNCNCAGFFQLRKVPRRSSIPYTTSTAPEKVLRSIFHFKVPYAFFGENRSFWVIFFKNWLFIDHFHSKNQYYPWNTHF